MLINKILNSTILAALMVFGVLMPATTYAQSDGFFRGSNDEYNNRAAEGLSNETFGTIGSGTPVPTSINMPLGNGLWIMLAAGAGYAVARRRRSRRNTTHVSKSTMFLLALTMIVSLTQCKKKIDTISSVDAADVFVTLDVGNSSKYSIVFGEGTAVVNYTQGDKIHVGCDGKYVGTLIHDGTYFSGNIANPKEGEYLYFYFVSGLLDGTEMSSATTTYNVSISDQRAQLPILSCGVSTEPYAEGKTSYTSVLHNKVALAKFTVDESFKSEEITIFNNLTEATIDFTNHTITPTGKKYFIKLYNPSEEASTERWSILMPQEYTSGTKKLAKAGENFCSYVLWGGMLSLQANGFYSGNVYNYSSVHGFTVSSSGNAVMVSSGNLQYNPSGNDWRVAPNQWDCLGMANANIAPDYTGYIDLFGWGAWGVGNNPTNSSTSSGAYNWTNDINESVMIDDYKGWRTPTKDEWDFMLNIRDVADNKRYIKTTCHGVLGLLVFPDVFEIVLWSVQQAFATAPDNVYNRQDVVYTYVYSGLTHDQIVDYLLGYGAVFLPAAGSRTGTSVQYTSDVSQMAGYYWSSTPNGTNNSGNMWFGYNNGNIGDAERCKGYSVRLVQ